MLPHVNFYGAGFMDTSASGGATDKIIRSTRRKGIPAGSNDWGRVGPTIDGPDLPRNMVSRSGRSMISRNPRTHGGSDGYIWKGPTNAGRASSLIKTASSLVHATSSSSSSFFSSVSLLLFIFLSLGVLGGGGAGDRRRRPRGRRGCAEPPDLGRRRGFGCRIWFQFEYWGSP